MSHGAYRQVPMSYYSSLADARRTLKENSLTALESQLELLEWLKRPSSIPVYEQFVKIYRNVPVGDEEGRKRLGHWIHRSVTEVATTATTFYVSPDMCELTKLAAENMPTSGLHAADLPADTGFLVFDHPMPLSQKGLLTEGVLDPADVHIAAVAGRVDSVYKTKRAASNPAFIEDLGDEGPGICYYLFSTPHDMATTYNLTSIERANPRRDSDEVRRYSGPMPLWDFSGWLFDTPWRSGDDLVSEDDSVVFPVVDQIRRLMLAAWRLIGQKNIVLLDPNRPPRHIRRRAERVGIAEDGDITIIRMRREVYQGLRQVAGGGDEDEPWYSIRFMVRGHWHGYWIGPRGQQTLTHKFILPYEKGPEGAPLVVKDEIISLER